MAKEDLEKLIISYVDGELHNNEAHEIKLAIEKDSSLMMDFKIHCFVKNMIANELKVSPVPDVVKRKVLNKLKSIK